MNGIFSKFTSPSDHLGIDIGTTSIKIAEVGLEKGVVTLKNYALFETLGHLERSNTALQTSTLKLFEDEIASYLRLIIRRAGFNAREAIVSIPAFQAFTTILDLPQMSQEDADRTIRFKAEQYIPLPINSVALDWVKVGEKLMDGIKTDQYFLISYPNEVIEHYKKIFNLVGLSLFSLELEGVSLARLLGSDQKPALIIDLGSRSTSLLAVKDGSLRLMSQTDYAGSSLTVSLASGLGINVRRAEDLKRQKGLSGLDNPADRELSTQMLPILSVILGEAKRLRERFESAYSLPIGQIILTGNGANLIGLEKYIGRELGLEVHRANPWQSIALREDLSPLSSELGASLSVALGLTAKYFK